MWRNALIGSRKSWTLARCLVLLALAVWCPAPGRAQTMVRGEPALAPTDTGGPVVSVNGSPNQNDDPTVRQPQVTGTGIPAAGSNNTSVLDDFSGSRGVAITANRMHWRPIFYLNLGVAYNDNIFIRSDKVGDLISTIEPGIILAAGNFREVLPRLGHFEHVFDVPTDDTEAQRFIYLDYHPSVYLFADNDSQNSVDESVTILGGYGFAKLSLGLNAQYQKLSLEDIDAGNRIDRDYYTLALTSLYTYSDKTSWDLDLYVNDNEYALTTYESSTEVLSRNYLNYQYGPKTQLSVGFAAGYIAYRSRADQTYEQALARVTSVQVAKIDFTLSGGIEFRQDSGSSDSVDGIFNLSVAFHPSDNATYSIVGSRGTEPSALENEEVTYTRFGVEWQQRFFSRIYLTLIAAYANADYQSVSTGTSLPRTDNIEEITARVDGDITPYLSLQFGYIFRNATSTLPGRTFSENIVSLDARFTY